MKYTAIIIHWFFFESICAKWVLSSPQKMTFSLAPFIWQSNNFMPIIFVCVQSIRCQRMVRTDCTRPFSVQPYAKRMRYANIRRGSYSTTCYKINPTQAVVLIGRITNELRTIIEDMNINNLNASLVLLKSLFLRKQICFRLWFASLFVYMAVCMYEYPIDGEPSTKKKQKPCRHEGWERKETSGEKWMMKQFGNWKLKGQW